MRWTAASLVTAALLQASPAPAYRWPWEPPVKHHRHHPRPASIETSRPQSDKGKVTPFAEPETNCKEILEAEKTLIGPDGQRWKHQLEMLTDGQRANIAKCLKDDPP